MINDLQYRTEDLDVDGLVEALVVDFDAYLLSDGDSYDIEMIMYDGEGTAVGEL